MPTEETCGEVIYQLCCDRPAGEPHEYHEASAALPPEVNMMVAQAMNQAEVAQHHYQTLTRWAGVWLCAAAIAALINIVNLFW